MAKKLTHSGLTDEQIKVCEDCKGEGRVPDKTGRFKFMNCPKCQGKGWVKLNECDHSLVPYQTNGVVFSKCEKCGWIK